MIQQIMDKLSGADSIGRANSTRANAYLQEQARPIEAPSIRSGSHHRRGALFMAEVSVPPGGGNPAHIHSREEEMFYMQQGTLSIQVGRETLTASPGDFICLPRGVAHCFHNNGNADAKFLLVAAPAGLEKFFEEAFYPVADCPDAPPMTEAFMGRVLLAASKCGLELLPSA